MSFEMLLLMTPAECAEMLGGMLGAYAGGRPIRTVSSRAELAALSPDELALARLISFTNPVIVPADCLARLGYGAYNFHPGPPQFPGLAPAQMAIYTDAALFGVTVHHMIAEVDAGPIVACEFCIVPPDARPFDLEVRAFALLAKALHALGAHLAHDPAPLPSIPVTWARQKSSRRQIAELCAMTMDLPPDEIDRRIRAFAGNGFGIDVTLDVGGQRVSLAGNSVFVADRTAQVPICTMPEAAARHG